ncbi:hypothetical protein [Halorubrum ezzemoulense]|uniref:hypothetical protein n=1 Tax=Halorubrum ezzemoulense TaxID=337243 RepID=UPI001C3CFA35
MRLEFDDGTLLLENAPETVPYAEWDDRVDAYRAQAYQHRALLEWAGQWAESDDQATLQDGFSHDVVNCLGIKPRGFFLRLSVTLPRHSRSGDLQRVTGSQSGGPHAPMPLVAPAGIPVGS